MSTKNTIYSSHGTPRFFFYLGIVTIGQTVIRPAFGFTISDWFFLVSLLLTTSECLMRRNLEIRFPPIMVIGLFFFTIGGVISSAFADRPFVSLIALTKYLYLIAVWFWLSITLLQTPVQIRTTIILWIISAAFSGLGAVMQIFWGDIIPGTVTSWGRMTGFTEHVNDLGGVTSIALIPAIMILTSFQKYKWQLTFFSLLCTILIVGGLVLSVSMAGALALMVSLSVWMLLSKYSHRKIIIISAACVLFLIIISIQSRYLGVSFLSRINDIFDNGLNSITIQTRLNTYAAAWDTIRNHPLLGVGLGPNLGSTKTGDVVHNIFLLNWFESGLFGLLGVLMILGAIALQAYKGILNPNREQERTLGCALFSSYITFLVLGLAQPIYYKRFGWISASLLIALYSTGYRSKIQQTLRVGSDNFAVYSN